MTPAIKFAQTQKLTYTLHQYEHDPAHASFGLEAAEKLAIDPARIFKTLLVSLSDQRLAVAILPVDQQLSMKRIAATMGAKKAEMANPNVIQSATGYVLGGVSPLGQIKRLPTALDESSLKHATLFVSAGKRGLELELRPQDLISACNATVARLVTH